jgi:hypothetical protein
LKRPTLPDKSTSVYKEIFSECAGPAKKLQVSTSCLFEDIR